MDPLRDTVERALGSQYDVIRLIGRGGMGAVYLARERLLERMVAVKVLPHEAAGDAAGRERFLREARTAARLSHPHIVPLHSFAEAEGTFLYVMGYVEGESLEARLAREGRVAPDESRRILAEIADALDHAHRQGVVHRDVKPDNILIESGTGHAWLTDFGIAKAGAAVGATRQETLTQAGMVVGTPHYMSPEQASADDVDGRSDIYALGVVGYRMLSGRLPFDGGSMREVLAAQVAREPQTLVLHEDDAAPVVAAVMRALRKSPAERWPTGRALADALRPGDGTPELPDELVDAPSTGTKLVAGAYAVTVMFAMLEAYVPEGRGSLMTVLIGPLVAVPIIVGGLLLRAKKHGIAPRDMLRMAFWAPATWWGWWPKRLRRPGDVWDRLPRLIRLSRTALTASFGLFAGVALPALGILLARVAGGFDVRGSLMQPVFMVGGAVSTVLMLTGSMLTWRWHRRFGVSQAVASRLWSERTWNNARFWNRPEIAALLETGRATPQLPRTTRELVDSIGQDVAALPPAVRDAVRGAPAAAAEVARALDAVDAELAELSKHADAGERERLEQRLGAMPTVDGEPAARRDMRDLLVGQLQLLDRLELRRRQLGDDRERLLALLKNLWHQVAALRSGAAQDARSVADLTGKVEAICAEVSGQRRAHGLETSTPALIARATAS